jgi:hypothetical protein
MTLASLEVRHSRSIAPTRRVAVGATELPTDPAPGFGGVLLAGVVAAHLDRFDPELLGDLSHVIDRIDAGVRIPQPSLRHRFQTDTHGLVRTTHRLLASGQVMRLALGDNDSPAAQILAAVHAAGRLPRPQRMAVVALIRKSLTWRGPAGPALVAFLTGGRAADAWSLGMLSDPNGWALATLGFPIDAAPSVTEVRGRFRHLVRGAHPDHGGQEDDAGRRLTDLSEARRILLT